MSQPSSRPLGLHPLYIGDVLGVRNSTARVPQRSFGRAKARNHGALASLDVQAGKPHWEIQEESFVVEVQGCKDKELVRDAEVQKNVHLLDRPWIEVGTRVGLREGSASAVIGRVTHKELLATVCFDKDPGLCLPNVPLERLYKEIHKPIGQKFIRHPFVGEIKSADYKVTLKYPGTGDTSTATLPLFEEGYATLGIGEPFKWSSEKLKSVEWGNSASTSFLVRKIKENLHANTFGEITNISMNNAVCNWIFNYETQQSASVNQLADMSEAKFFSPLHHPGHNIPFSLTLTPEDVNNVKETEEWERNILGEPSQEASGDRGPAAKIARMHEPLKAGSSYCVNVVLVQTKLGVTWALNERDNFQEELFSSKVERIADLNTLEIGHPAYVVPRFPKTEMKNLIGFVPNYFPGESETVVNPSLNPENLTTVTWFTVNPDGLTEDHTSVTCVYDLIPINTDILFNSILAIPPASASQTSASTATHIVGSFDKILESGMIRIRDLDEGMHESWPNLVQLYNDNDTQLRQIFAKALERSENKYSGFNLRFNFSLQSPKVAVFERCPPADYLSVNEVNEERVRIDVEKLRNTSAPLIWFATYRTRQDIITLVIGGKPGTPHEGMLYTVHAQIPISYPGAPPIIHIHVDPEAPLHDLTFSQLTHLVRNSGQFNWTAESALVDYFTFIQELVLAQPGFEASLPQLKIHSKGKSTPLEGIYTKDELASGKWKARWSEVTKIEEVELVFQKLTKPGQYQLDSQLKGHYVASLPLLCHRWTDWVAGEANDGSPPPSEGFKRTITTMCDYLKEKFIDQPMDITPIPPPPPPAPDLDDDDDETEDPWNPKIPRLSHSDVPVVPSSDEPSTSTSNPVESGSSSSSSSSGDSSDLSDSNLESESVEQENLTSKAGDSEQISPNIDESDSNIQASSSAVESNLLNASQDHEAGDEDAIDSAVVICGGFKKDSCRVSSADNTSQWNTVSRNAGNEVNLRSEDSEIVSSNQSDVTNTSTEEVNTPIDSTATISHSVLRDNPSESSDASQDSSNPIASLSNQENAADSHSNSAKQRDFTKVDGAEAHLEIFQEANPSLSDQNETTGENVVDSSGESSVTSSAASNPQQVTPTDLNSPSTNQVDEGKGADTNAK